MSQNRGCRTRPKLIFSSFALARDTKIQFSKFPLPRFLAHFFFQVLLRHKVCDWLLAADDGLVWAYHPPSSSTEVSDSYDSYDPMLIPWTRIVASHHQKKGCNTTSSGGCGSGSGIQGGSDSGNGGSEWRVQWPRRKSAARMLEKALRAYESDTAEIADAARTAAAFETAAGLARCSSVRPKYPTPSPAH